MGQEARATEFQGAEYAEAYPDGIQHHYWSRSRNAAILSLLSSLGLRNGLLEIGAGRGVVVDYLRRHGIESRGIDIAVTTPITSEVEPFLAFGKDAFDLDGDVRAATTGLLLFDVLEHLEEPSEFLSLCARKFPNARLLVGTVPARQEIWSNYDERFGHYRRYDLSACREFASGSGGWRLLRAGYLFHSLYLAALILRVLGLNRASHIRAPQTPVQQGIHALLAGLFYVESKILPAQVPGSSILFALGR